MPNTPLTKKTRRRWPGIGLGAPPALRAKAFRLYVESPEKITLSTIATQLGLNVHALRTWVSFEGWATFRESRGLEWLWAHHWAEKGRDANGRDDMEERLRRVRWDLRKLKERLRGSCLYDSSEQAYLQLEAKVSAPPPASTAVALRELAQADIVDLAAYRKEREEVEPPRGPLH